MQKELLLTKANYVVGVLSKMSGVPKHNYQCLKKSVLLLCDIDNFPQIEVAKTLEISQPTVHRILKKVRKESAIKFIYGK